MCFCQTRRFPKFLDNSVNKEEINMEGLQKIIWKIRQIDLGNPHI